MKILHLIQATFRPLASNFQLSFQQKGESRQLHQITNIIGWHWNDFAIEINAILVHRGFTQVRTGPRIQKEASPCVKGLLTHKKTEFGYGFQSKVLGSCDGQNSASKVSPPWQDYITSRATKNYYFHC